MVNYFHLQKQEKKTNMHTPTFLFVNWMEILGEKKKIMINRLETVGKKCSSTFPVSYCWEEINQHYKMETKEKCERLNKGFYNNENVSFKERSGNLPLQYGKPYLQAGLLQSVLLLK